MIKQLLFSLLLLITLPLPAAPNGKCVQSLQESASKPRHAPILIQHDRFEELVLALRKTLSGNLATVFRSEWKTKLTVSEANEFMDEMAKTLLDPETYQEVRKGLNKSKESFTRNLHARIAKRIQDQGPDSELKKSLMLSVRDTPPPPATTDTTFTFYLRSILDATGQGEGKHQVRIRNYVRLIDLNQINSIAIGEQINGFNPEGLPWSIQRVDEEHFQITNGKQTAPFQTQAELKAEYGSQISVFAPHGGKYKLEVKSALLDKIGEGNFPVLGGHHMVQKLDVSLSPQQVQSLYAPLEGTTTHAQKEESLSRVDRLEKELNAKNPAQTDRTKAVLDILREGIKNDTFFLAMEGATLYHRSAFESPLGFQLTVDRRQKVFAQNLYTETDGENPSRLRSPMEIMKTKAYLSARADAARHVELKLPFYAVEKIFGMDYSSPQSIEGIPTKPVMDRLTDAVAIYAQFVKNAYHKGKFNFLLQNGASDNEDPGEDVD